MTARVDVIVVTHQSREHVGPCLDSVAASGGVSDVDVVVIDNASDDGTAAVARAHASAPRVVANRRNRGFAAACNQGIAATSGDYVLLLNPDARLRPDTLSRLVGHLDAHPAAAIAGPRLLNEDGALQPQISATGLFPSFPQALHEYTRLGRLRPASRWHAEYFLTRWDRRTTRTVAMIQGACLLVRRSVLEELGAFDERFFLYFEETDLCKRVADRGWETHYVGDATAVHIGSQSSSDGRPSAHHFIASLYRFHRKHYGLGEATALWAILMPYHALRAARLTWRLPFQAGDAVLREDLRTARERFKAHWSLLRDSARRPPRAETHS